MGHCYSQCLWSKNDLESSSRKIYIFGFISLFFIYSLVDISYICKYLIPIFFLFASSALGRRLMFFFFYFFSRALRLWMILSCNKKKYLKIKSRRWYYLLDCFDGSIWWFGKIDRYRNHTIDILEATQFCSSI